MQLFLTRTFQKNFERLPEEVRRRAKEALLKIRKDPGRGKRLQGELKGEFSFRVGSYRIIYTLDGAGNIWVETIRARKDAYR
jgi:mRNA-degrading endonuclease RelE of RelBE toxin-antitoxin system